MSHLPKNLHTIHVFLFGAGSLSTREPGDCSSFIELKRVPTGESSHPSHPLGLLVGLVGVSTKSLKLLAGELRRSNVDSFGEDKGARFSFSGARKFSLDVQSQGSHPKVPRWPPVLGCLHKCSQGSWCFGTGALLQPAYASTVLSFDMFGEICVFSHQPAKS